MGCAALRCSVFGMARVAGTAHVVNIAPLPPFPYGGKGMPGGAGHRRYDTGGGGERGSASLEVSVEGGGVICSLRIQPRGILLYVDKTVKLDRKFARRVSEIVPVASSSRRRRDAAAVAKHGVDRVQEGEARP